jgi:hypothetical protein
MGVAMTDATTPTATVLPPAVARATLVVRFDLLEASENITELFDELNDDGSNARYVTRRIMAEIEWIFELLGELAESVER